MAAEGGLDLEPMDGGHATLLPVKAQPGASRSALVGLSDGRLRVALTGPPLHGRANGELLKLLASALGLRARDLELVRGARSRRKQVRVPLRPEVLLGRLLPLLPSPS